MFPHGGETAYPLGEKRPKSRRVARISERIREAVSEIILFGLKDPRIGFVTVLEATVTPDVKEATVRISVLGSPARKRLTLEAIEHSRGYIQKQLGRRLKTRNTPTLRFELDEKTEKVKEIEETLEKIRRERLEKDGGASRAPEDGNPE